MRVSGSAPRVISTVGVGLLALCSGAAAAGRADSLIEAVKASHVDTVRTLVEQRADVNATEADGATALHWAVYHDDAALSELLLRAGANARATNDHGVSPLSLACTSGNVAIIEMLLEAGADPNAAIGDGETALMTAARSGVVEAVQALLSHGAAVDVPERWKGQTALMWAAAEGHTPVVKLLTAHHANVNARSIKGFTPLLYAVREGHIETTRALLEAGADINGALPLGMEGPVEPALVVGSVSGATNGTTSAITLAVRNAHYELARFLLEYGADPNDHTAGWTPLHELTWVRRPGGGANFPGPVGSGSMDSLAFARLLVADGADVNARMTRRPRNGLNSALNRIGATPFLLAARNADLPLMRLLVELGADPSLTNDDGTTPLMAAAGLGVHSPGEDAGTEAEALEATRLALELGGDVNAVDKNGETAMHGAAYLGVNSVVQFLVEKGAQIEVWNQKNSSGWTPLTIADGVFRTANFRAAPRTAELLRQILAGGQ
jgi:ankyrin repeat protein